MGNLFLFACQNQLKLLAKFLRVPIHSSCFPLKISMKSKKKKVFTYGTQMSCSPLQMLVKSKKKSSRAQMSYFPLKTVTYPGGGGRELLSGMLTAWGGGGGVEQAQIFKANFLKTTNARGTIAF